MLLTTLASTTLANEQCAGQNVFSESCKQPKPKNILGYSEKKIRLQYDYTVLFRQYSAQYITNQ